MKRLRPHADRVALGVALWWAGISTSWEMPFLPLPMACVLSAVLGMLAGRQFVPVILARRWGR